MESRGAAIRAQFRTVPALSRSYFVSDPPVDGLDFFKGFSKFLGLIF